MHSNIKDSDIFKKLGKFFKKNGEIRLMFLFGSIVTKKITKKSDIDIGILFDKYLDIYKLNDMKVELDSLLKREVDIVVLNSASPILKMQVLKTGVLISGKDKKVYNQFYVNTIGQYDDIKRVRKICEDNILNGRIYA